MLHLCQFRRNRSYLCASRTPPNRLSWAKRICRYSMDRRCVITVGCIEMVNQALLSKLLRPKTQHKSQIDSLETFTLIILVCNLLWIICAVPVLVIPPCLAKAIYSRPISRPNQLLVFRSIKMLFSSFTKYWNSVDIEILSLNRPTSESWLKLVPYSPDYKSRCNSIGSQHKMISLF